MSVVRTWTLKFQGEVADLEKKARQARQIVDDTTSRWKSAAKGLQGAGDGMQSVGKSLNKHITAPVVGATTAVTALTAGLGFKRLVGIDRARAQFEGLGMDANKVMEQVDKGVTGTALSMAEGASLAVGALATDNLPMKDLEAQIKRVSNLSAAYGLEAEQAGSLMNKVLVKNKVEWGDLSQMQENGIPVVSALAKHYGVTGDKIQKMAAKGKISIKDLNKALDKESGKAAEAYAGSWEGIVANIKSNIGRIGADILAPAFAGAKEHLTSFLALMKSDEAKVFAKSLGEQLGTGLARAAETIKGLVTAWQELSPAGKQLAGTIAGIAIALGPILSIGGRIVSGIGMVIGIIPKLQAGFAVIKAVIAAIAGPIGLVIAAVAALVAGVVWFATQTETGRALVASAWEGIKGAIAAVSDWWTTTAQPAMAGAWQALLDAGAAVVGWWTSTAAPAIQTVWRGVQDAASAVAAWYQTNLAPVFQAAGELIMEVFSQIASNLSSFWTGTVQPVLAGIGAAWAQTWAGAKQVWSVIGPPIISAIQTSFQNLLVVVDTIWRNIRNAIETALGVIRSIIRAITAAIRGDWEGAWRNIKEAGARIVSGIRTSIENSFSGMAQILSNTWGSIRDSAARIWGSVRSAIMGVVDPLIQRIKLGFEGMRDGIGRAMNGIKAKAAKPVNFVINTIWNNGLRKVLNLIPGVNLGEAKPIRGYRTGGYTGDEPDDRVLRVAHRKEYVLNRREVEAMGGPTGVEAWKEAAIGGAGGGSLGRAHRPVPGGHSGWNGGRYRSGKVHGGLDFPAGTGTPIRAMWGGTVTRALRLNRSYGHHAFIGHGGGITTVYAHMSRLGVRAGQRVAGGQIIGAVGSTGNSTGPHLHLEVRRGGARVNPGPYLAGATMLKGGEADDVQHEDPLLHEVPAKVAELIRKINSELVGPWGSLLRTGVLGSMNTAKEWALKKIRGFERGTSYAPPGVALVGEGGPEFVVMKGGEQVIPHRRTVDLLNGLASGGQSELDLDRLVELLTMILAAVERRREEPIAALIQEGEVRRVARAEIGRLRREGIMT